MVRKKVAWVSRRRKTIKNVDESWFNKKPQGKI
jgi:hypothetical protein